MQCEVLALAVLFIYFLLMISDEDFYGGRTGPLEKFYLFIYFL